MNKVITLTSEASKRLIAKAVVQMPEVQRAYNFGYIALSLGTTCGFIVEELYGSEIARSRYRCRYISSKGPCILSPEEQFGLTLFVHGEMITIKNKKDSVEDYEGVEDYLKEMGTSDVLIKSGNVIDSAGKVACLRESEDIKETKGTINIISKYVFSIIPMTINKAIPGNVEKLIQIVNKEKITKMRCLAEPSDIVLLEGKLITEVEAAKSLLDVDILPIAISGFGANRSTTTFLLYGEDNIVKNAYYYLDHLKNEPQLIEIEDLDCKHCPSYILSR